MTTRWERIRTRLAAEDGFGLMEVMIAITVLNVGIFAVMGAFSSSYVAINRSKRISSASVLVDQQMERFRALSFQSVCLATVDTGATYTESAPTGTPVPTCSTSDPALVAKRTPVTGPDNRTYRIDTYAVWRCVNGTLSTSPPNSASTPACTPTGGGYSANPTKLVRIVVRNAATTNVVYAQEESTFDLGTSS